MPTVGNALAVMIPSTFVCCLEKLEVFLPQRCFCTLLKESIPASTCLVRQSYGIVYYGLIGGPFKQFNFRGSQCNQIFGRVRTQKIIDGLGVGTNTFLYLDSSADYGQSINVLSHVRRIFKEVAVDSAVKINKSHMATFSDTPLESQALLHCLKNNTNVTFQKQ